MAITEPEAPVVGDKGLQAGALGLVGNVVIGLSAVAPAYSLAATLGYVVLVVQDKAPSMFVLAFIPMLLVAFAYKELSEDTPDCGTTFTWGTKAFGPWIGWIGGWGLAVSAIIVLANVAEIAAIYLYDFLGLNRGEEWVSRAIGALGDRGVNATSTVVVGESFAGSLIDFTEQEKSDLIVIGGARDAIFGGQVGPARSRLKSSDARPQER